MPEKNYSCVLTDYFPFNVIQYPLSVQRELNNSSVVTIKPIILTTQCIYIPPFHPNNQQPTIFPSPTTINCLLVTLMSTQFALCHARSHLLKFISASIIKWHTILANRISPTRNFLSTTQNLIRCPTLQLIAWLAPFHQQIVSRSRNQLRWGPGTRRNGKWRFQFRHGWCRSENSSLMSNGHSDEFQRTSVGTKWSVGHPQSSSDPVRHK
jgi:hypothetical protein